MTSWPGWPAQAAAWPTPSASPSPRTCSKPSCSCRTGSGNRPMTRTAGPGPVRGWPRSPECWTCHPGRGMRLIVRKERPHPGARLRFTDPGGHQFTCFATNTKRGQLADLELRHRRRARCEDRCAKDTGLRNLPLHGYAQNQIWCEIVALACELLSWMAMLALTGPARRWEPRRLRLRLLLHRRAHHQQRPPPSAPPRRDLAMGRGRPPPRSPASGAHTQLTSAEPSPRQKGQHPGPWNPAHPARQPGNQPDRATRKRPRSHPRGHQPRSRRIRANPTPAPLARRRYCRMPSRDLILRLGELVRPVSRNWLFCTGQIPSRLAPGDTSRSGEHGRGS